MCYLRPWLHIATALLLTACSVGQEIPAINIGHAPHDHHAALYIAASRPEYFKNNGGLYLKESAYRKHYELYDRGTLLARLNLSASTGGKQLIRRLHERQLDICCGGVPAMIQTIDAGSPLCILMPLMTGGSGLMLKKELPVEDWAGFITYLSQAREPVRIGYKIASSVQNLIFEQALAFEHVPFARTLQSENIPLVLVNMYGAKNLIPGIRNGVIDGFVVMEPYLTLAQKELGARMICPLDKLPPEGQWSAYPCCALAAVDRAFVRDNQRVVVALVRLIRLAHAYIHDHPEDAAKAVADWLHLPEEIEQISLPSIHFLQDFTPEWRAGVRSWVRALMSAGTLTGAVAEAEKNGNLDKVLYDTGPLQEAKREIQ